MKTKQFFSVPGIKLGKTQMQTVKGGWRGVWTCVTNNYSCHGSYYECKANCSSTYFCQLYDYCLA